MDRHPCGCVTEWDELHDCSVTLEQCDEHAAVPKRKPRKRTPKPVEAAADNGGWGVEPTKHLSKANQKLDEFRAAKGYNPAVETRIQGKMALLVMGELSVADMDNEELGRMQFRDRDGNFSGRPPGNIPAKVLAVMRRELLDRAAKAREAYYVDTMEQLAKIANDPAVQTKDRLRAMAMMMDRTEGRPTERIEVSTGDRGFEITLAKSVKRLEPGEDE